MAASDLEIILVIIFSSFYLKIIALHNATKLFPNIAGETGY